MSYQKQYFVPEQYLSAAELNHLEDGIELNRTLARNFEAAHIETLFKNSEVEPERIIDNNTSGWSEVQSAPSINEHTYLILRISSNNNWSKPIKISSMSYFGGEGSEGGGNLGGGDTGAEFEEQLEEIRTELNKQLEELNKKLKDAEDKIIAAEGKADAAVEKVNEQKKQFDQLVEEMKPIADWSGDTGSSAAGFVAKANQDLAQLAGIVTWKSENEENIRSMAVISETATAQGASIEQWVGYTFENKQAISSLRTEVTEDYVKTEEISTYINDEVLSEAVNQIETTLGTNYAKRSELLSLRDKTSQAISTFETNLNNYGIAQEQLLSFKTTASETLDQHTTELTENCVKHSDLAAFTSTDGFKQAVKSYTEEVTEDYVKTEDIATYINDEVLTQAVHQIENTLNTEYAKRSELTAFIDNKELTEAFENQKTELNKTFATREETLVFVTEDELGKEISKSKTTIEQDVEANYATISSVADVDDKVSSIQQTVEGNTTAIGLIVDNKTVKGSVLVKAINDQSEVSISGDKINLNGNATFTSAIAAANNAANSAATKANNAVKSVQYFYLSTGSPTTAPSENDSGWKTTADEWQSGKYLWQKTAVTKGDDTVINSIICLTGASGAVGAPGASLEVRYINSETTPVISGNNVTGWSTTVPAPEANKATYMTQKLDSEPDWSIPVQITGKNGKDGVTPEIGINADGYWVVNGETTDQKATGEDGETPEITIQDGKWFINGVSTNINATGEAGKDGESIEFVYYRSHSPSPPPIPPDTVTAAPPRDNIWTISPSGITEDFKYEYMSMRVKPSGIDQSWGKYSTPVIWSKWGEKGQDGDGVEYWYQVTDLPYPEYDLTEEWADEPQGVSEAKPYEYVKAIKHFGDGNTKESSPKLWAIYSKDGQNGAAAPKVKEVKTQYTFTSSDKTAPGDSATWGYDDIPTNWTSSDPVCVWTRDEFTFDNGDVIYSDAVFNQSYSNIANWCDAKDRTLINGANIAAGSITANKIDATYLKVDAANIEGTLTASQIDATYLKVDAANIEGTLTASQVDATNLKVKAANITGTLSANQIDASNLKVKAANITDTLSASQINGEGLKISSADSSSSTAITIDGGQIKIAKTKNSANKGYLSFDGTNVKLYGDGIPLYLQSSTRINLSTQYDMGLDSSYGNITQEAGGKIIFVPAQNTASTTSSHKLNLEWDSTNSRLALKPENKMIISSSNNFAIEAPIVYLEASNYGQLAGTWQLDAGVLVTSAREAKNSIEDVDNRYSVLLDNLKPRRFKYNDGTSNRYHTGLIVDELRDAMDIAEIDSSEFAAYCLDENGGGIRYSELVALLIKEVQDLKKQVAELKSPTE